MTCWGYEDNFREGKKKKVSITHGKGRDTFKYCQIVSFKLFILYVVIYFYFFTYLYDTRRSVEISTEAKLSTAFFVPIVMPSTAGFWVTLDISWIFKMCCYDLSFHFLLFIFPSFSEVITSAFDLSPVETTLAFNRYCVSSEEQTFLWASEEKKQGEEQERFMRHVSGSQTFSTAWHFCREDCSQTSTPRPPMLRHSQPSLQVSTHLYLKHSYKTPVLIEPWK